MSFHEVRYPVQISLGASGGPELRTEIVALVNGYEERNNPWAHSRRRFDAGAGLRSLDELATLIAFFEARRGQLHGFRWKDWADYKTCLPSQTVSALDQQIGIGDGATKVFQLRKTYASGSAKYMRDLVKPVAGTVRVAVAGVEQTSPSQVTVDSVTGLVTFNLPPAQNKIVTAGCEFDVPVRFDTDRISASIASFEAGDIPAVPVIEVRL